jgi:hypothetical protein
VADLVITANNVSPGTNSTKETLIAKEVITAGQGVAKDPADGKIGLWDSNSANAWRKIPYGIALHNVQINQPIVVHKSGRINIGAAVTVGLAYFMSATPGGIAVQADVVTGMNSVFVGIATTTAELSVSFVDFGVPVP